jgi:hypothetical protein
MRNNNAAKLFPGYGGITEMIKEQKLLGNFNI